MRKPRKARRQTITVEELERLLAERAGEPRSRVIVRGRPPDWTATLIATPTGNAERKARFWSLANDLRAEYDLAE